MIYSNLAESLHLVTLLIILTEDTVIEPFLLLNLSGTFVLSLIIGTLTWPLNHSSF